MSSKGGSTFWVPRTWLALASLAGMAAVAFGAFGAHGVSDPQAQQWLRTGGTYAFVHVLATFACAGLIRLGSARARHAPALFLGGVALFSGTLFAMGLGAPHWLGTITPLGGLLFMAGWAVLAWAALGMD